MEGWKRKGEKGKRGEREGRAHLFPHVDHLTPSHLLIQLTIQRLIALLIVLNPLPKVLLRLLRRLTVVVRVARGNFNRDVGGDYGGVSAD